MVTKKESYDLSRRNTFGMKVSCRLYVEVTEPEDLLSLDFDALPQPLFVLGGGSNLLFTGDFPGTVLHLAIRFLDSALPCSARNDKETDIREASPVIPTKAEGRVEESEHGQEAVIPGLTGNLLVRAGAGVVFDDFCAWAAAQGLWGPENLSLIPGEVGASAVQNIGAYGVEAKDIIDTVHAFDLTTRTFVDIPGADCAYGYRTSRFKTDWKGRYLITAVTFRLSATHQPKLDYGGVRKAIEVRFLDSALPGSARNDKETDTREAYPVISTKAEGRVEKSGKDITPDLIRDTIIDIRRQKLPDPEEIGSAGSFFCNPVIEREHFERIVALAKAENGPDYEVPHYDVGERVKVPAAWMIDQCGFKGMRLGGAQVYPKQPLVIVNATGAATPDEIIALERRVIDTIREKYGIELHPEVEHVAAQKTDNQ
ncbi:MAG: UDP-N-acetylmuramate dehydrogenase [Bacteroidales bacterium]|nr:UDP-N-acetylmuramate dehydrogenase [Bacteroidales bacterium]